VQREEIFVTTKLWIADAGALTPGDMQAIAGLDSGSSTSSTTATRPW
jgi:hypothetical protein